MDKIRRIINNKNMIISRRKEERIDGMKSKKEQKREKMNSKTIDNNR